MAAVTKAVLLNIGAFLADNNVRRNVGAFSYNFTSPTANLVTNYLSLNPGDTITWNTPMTSSVFTMLSCNGNLTVSFTFRPSGSYNLTVGKVHIVDSDVGQMVITNPSATAVVNVSLIQA